MSVPAPRTTSPSQNPGRTKAKQRYLKRKKERRKHRKVETPSQTLAGATVPRSPGPEENDSPHESSEDEQEKVVVESIPPTSKTKEPARKRRKVTSDFEQDAEESDSSSASEPETAPRRPDDEPQSSAPTPAAAAFPSFPLPVAPDAPSKQTLALQGLDKALLGAEIVDATDTLPIDGLDTSRDANAGDLPVLGERVKRRLLDLGITEFFAVQTALLPFLLPPQRRSRALYCPYDPPRDVCASAPTGSGKTLAYVIPIVEILSTRIATRLRALIVLPTRDLAVQVQETFEAVSKGRGLKAAVVTGQHSFSHEQTQLVHDQDKLLQGGGSKVDILICTPGRLMDHLNATPGFTLQHLRFLVIDEADRLLAQSFQDWLAQVLSALRPPAQSVNDDLSSLSLESSSEPSKSLSLRHDALAPTFLPHIPTDFDDVKHPSCQKLLFSATLTRDPARIAALGLRDPKYFVVQGTRDTEGEATPAAALGMEDFAMPAGLKEHYITTSTARKPLTLFYLVHKRAVSNALVFTKSANSTARLVKLFELFEEAYLASIPTLPGENETAERRIVAQAYSSDLTPGERKSILEKFKKQKIDILVCSDLVARGLDIPHVAHVVSYDAPVDVRKYVHRAGRTARAGRTGDAWTLVEEQEAKFFKDMLREAGEGRLERVARVRVRDAELKEMEECYDTALELLKRYYSRNTSS